MLNNKNTYIKFQNIKKTTSGKIILGYALISAVCSLGFIYNDGRRALIKYRKTEKNYKKENELQMIRDNLNIFSNVLDAFVFPWTFGKLIIPHIIFYTTR